MAPMLFAKAILFKSNQSAYSTTEKMYSVTTYIDDIVEGVVQY